VLRTDAAALKRKRKQRFLNGTAACLNAPLALLNVALHAALSTPLHFMCRLLRFRSLREKAKRLFARSPPPANPSHQMRPQDRRAIRPECLSTPIIGAICQRPAARSLPGALTTKCARHRCGCGLRPCPRWRSGSALRGLDLQSREYIYQSDPFCPSLRQHRPSTPERASSRVQGREDGRAKYAKPGNGFGDVALADFIGTRLPGPSHGARYGVSGAALASLFQDHPTTLRRGTPTPKYSPR